MRDGIYKTLPVPRWWKSVLRSCERDAERGETLCRLAERATESDALRELTPKFLNQLMQIVSLDESSFPGMCQLQEIREVRGLGGMNTPLENDLLAKTRRMQESGVQHPVERALEDSLLERQQSMYRHAQSHYRSKAGDQSQPFLSALSNALENVSRKEIASRILRGDQKTTGKIRRPIDVDHDDLSAPL